MRGVLSAVLLFVFASAIAAAPDPGAAPANLERVGLRSIAGWLKAHGTEGHLGADVAAALGIGPSDGRALDARQRGFRNAAVLRIAQLLPDGSVLFMVQRDGGEVAFYHSTLRDGLRRALVSLPGRGLVVPLEGVEAESRFRAEILYWEDKVVNH